MDQELIKKIIFALLVLCLVGYIHNEYQSSIVHERQNIGHASMVDIRGNKSWVLDLVRHMDPENPARKALISKLKNHGVDKKFLKALLREITPQQKQRLK